MSTTPFVPGWIPWLHEALGAPEPPPSESPPLALALPPDAGVAAVARVEAVVAVACWLAAAELLPPPEEPHPAMISTTAENSVVLETAETVRYI
jgi:hypothetical protein